MIGWSVVCEDENGVSRQTGWFLSEALKMPEQCLAIRAGGTAECRCLRRLFQRLWIHGHFDQSEVRSHHGILQELSDVVQVTTRLIVISGGHSGGRGEAWRRTEYHPVSTMPPLRRP